MLESALKSDIFFFITSIAVVGVTVMILITLLYVAEILRDIRHVSKKVRDESDHLADVLRLVADDIQKGTSKVRKLASVALPLAKIKKAVSKSGTKKK